MKSKSRAKSINHRRIKYFTRFSVSNTQTTSLFSSRKKHVYKDAHCHLEKISISVCSFMCYIRQLNCFFYNFDYELPRLILFLLIPITDDLLLDLPINHFIKGE